MADPAKVMRFDSGSLRPPVKNPSTGFLRVDGYVSRVGIYEYADSKYPDGIRRELRPHEEVMREDSLAGYEGAPVTVMHPQSMISTANVRAYEVGLGTSKGRPDGERVAASMVIKDPKAISRMDSGELVELSPGYKIRLDHTPGSDLRYATPRNPNGRYDLVQRDIEINHFALLPKNHARGGEGMRVRMDGIEVDVERTDASLDAASRENLSDSQFAVPESRKLPINDEAHLRAAMSRFGQTDFASAAEKKSAYNRIVARAKKLGVDSTGFEQAWTNRLDAAVSRQGAPTMEQEEQIRLLKAQIAELEGKAKERSDALTTHQERADRAEARVRALEGEVTELNAKISAGASAAESAAIKEQADRADKAEDAIRKFDERFDTAVEERCAIIDQARAVMGPDFTIGPKMSNRDIQAVVVKRLDSKADVSQAATDASIDGSFRALLDIRNRTARSLVRASGSLSEHRGDARQTVVNKREEKRDAHRNQWREPLPSSQPARQRQKGG